MKITSASAQSKSHRAAADLLGELFMDPRDGRAMEGPGKRKAPDESGA